MKILGLIPARSGSKRLPNKNIMKINGLTLIEIAYMKLQILRSMGHDIYPLVSSDSLDYLKLVPEYHGSFRPDHLSTDSASSWDVVRWEMGGEKQTPFKATHCLLLQCTSPLIKVADLDRMIRYGSPCHLTSLWGHEVGAWFVDPDKKENGEISIGGRINENCQKELNVDIDDIYGFRSAELSFLRNNPFLP